MNEKKSICVFCGSSNNVPKHFIEEAEKIGNRIAKENYNLVFGAGDCGLMGATANSALNAGGTVTGVYPRILEKIEKEHTHLTEIIIVDDMHTRKMHMFNRSDAFIVLPGGFGTMDETFEVITWKQLETHKKPIAIYNYSGYYNSFEKMTNQFLSMGFASLKTGEMYKILKSIDEVFAYIKEEI